jgi:MFS family permease
MLVIRIVLAKIISVVPYIHILIGCMLSGMIGMLLIAFSRTAFLFLLAAVFYGIMHGTSQPTLNTVSVMNVPQERRGAATATFYISVDAGMGIGSLLWGGLIDHIPQMYTYMIAAALLVVCIILIVILLCPKRGG